MLNEKSKIMKKSFLNYCIMFFAVVLFGLSIIGCGEQEYISKCLKEAEDAMDNGDYMGAYVIADEMIAKGYVSHAYDAGQVLNEKILTSEIAGLIGTDDNPSAKIILAIKERAIYNRNRGEKEMLELAIQVAQANGNDDLATKLQTTLDSWGKEDKKSGENEDNDNSVEIIPVEIIN